MNKSVKDYRFHEIIRQIDVLNSESDWEVWFSSENVSLIDEEQSFRYLCIVVSKFKNTS